MATAAVQYKIMPEGLDIDLSQITEKAKVMIEEKGGVLSNTEEKPVAFGLKALILSLAYPEEKDVDELGNLLNEIEGVSSAEMIDYRRAIG